MNKKNFKIEYDVYMKNIKPSKELIEKTIKTAHKQQEDLKQAKDKKFFSFIYNINFRIYSAIACTLLFTLFAVKLWNNISKESVPVEPIQTTTIENSYNDTVQNVTETTKVSIIESEFTTPNDISEELTQTEEDIVDGSSTNITYNHQSLDSSNYVTSINNIQSDANTHSNSTTYNTYDNTSSGGEVEITVTNVPQNTSILDNSTITTKTTDDQNGITSTFFATTLPVEITDYSSETYLTDENNNNGQPETTSIPSFTTNVSSDNTMEEMTTMVENTTVQANTTMIENTFTTTNMPIEPNPNNYEQFVALKVILYNNSNGFFYNGTIYSGKIKLYFSFGNDIVCILKLGDTLTENKCEAILIIRDNNVSNSLNQVITELNTGYSSIDIMNNNSFQIFSAPKDLDFNGNGVGASSDVLDLTHLYDILYIDD